MWLWIGSSILSLINFVNKIGKILRPQCLEFSKSNQNYFSKRSSSYHVNGHGKNNVLVQMMSGASCEKSKTTFFEVVDQCFDVLV